MKPISDTFVPEALAVSGLDRDRLIREAPTPEQAMAQAARWVNDLRAAWAAGVPGCLDGLPHTHHAGDDAAELAQVFEAVLRR
ncbi:hypothetical protein ABZ897_52615 [Nonomuraea sp. NPDC046802]|uniref:hypothetical protein n=1 Tax=Nonomuraea sp. NPDC046802 TaxID=3154919 RepID=UPI0033D17B87